MSVVCCMSQVLWINVYAVLLWVQASLHFFFGLLEMVKCQWGNLPSRSVPWCYLTSRQLHPSCCHREDLRFLCIWYLELSNGKGSPCLPFSGFGKGQDLWSRLRVLLGRCGAWDPEGCLLSSWTLPWRVFVGPRRGQHLGNERGSVPASSPLVWAKSFGEVSPPLHRNTGSAFCFMSRQCRAEHLSNDCLIKE